MSHKRLAQRNGIARLAHDLNNSLGVILGRCEMLGSLLADNTDAAAQINEIERVARKLANSLTSVDR
jgi:signal transduction histidine kinase